MALVVWFVDTSVLVNVLDLDGFNQDRDSVAQELKKKVGSGDTLILPVTTVIETGNHIAHLHNGTHRREVAAKFAALLLQIRDGVAPWRLHSVHWDGAFLDHLVSGASTGATLIEQAVVGMGCGDLCILAEREAYRSNSGIADVRVWSLDQHLQAYQ
ncbi:hypothetical protein EDD99_2704 [Streptomyces sp. 846.5]|nr:hypothetical protein [Streptomyces sp. 846.5]TDU04248.1 hypothetical protein EDD99_2704 [Streptomyces sp. 846.5]